TPARAVFANRISGIRPMRSATTNFSPQNSTRSGSAGTGTPECERLPARGDLEVEGAGDKRQVGGLLEGGRDLTALDRLVANEAQGVVEGLPADHGPDLSTGGRRVHR